ncbi:uncharacterized protein N7525_004671 [Penicillium rubens]|uniref:uncharacterized protein n=1 Tax=Penicillium rubens TaxID=1108849 RepID=UPI002A598491|nr:uncharacterized protein N7525_004671 [Penicillium rubens]KAJ5839483.1 hypothetical protein N7525_004671 [Penicillium rubens]
MRQLYQAYVTPVMDYASTVWHDPLRDKTHLRHLNTDSSHHDSRSRGIRSANAPAPPPPSVKHHHKPSHSAARSSYLGCTTTSLETEEQYRRRSPRPLLPWRAESFTDIEIGLDRETARERAESVRSTSTIVVYSDTSGCDSHLGAATAALDNNLQIIESQ